VYMLLILSYLILTPFYPSFSPDWPSFLWRLVCSVFCFLVVEQSHQKQMLSMCNITEWSAAVPDSSSMENGVHIACHSLVSEWIYFCSATKELMWLELNVNSCEYEWVTSKLYVLSWSNLEFTSQIVRVK